jgi:hypothetical protein
MLILFDQATPVPLRLYLKGHTIRTAYEQGWDRLTNGELLRAAENAGFNALPTTDKAMRYQQNLEGRRIAVLVLSRQQWPELRPHVQLIAEAISSAKPGSFTELAIPPEP